MTSIKYELEQKLGLLLNGVCSIKVLDLDEYSPCSFKDENGLHLVMPFEFNFVSNDTKTFLILMKLYLTEFGWDELCHLSELELTEEIVQSTLYAGRQVDFYNPAKPAIEAIKNYNQYLDHEEAKGFDEILDILHGQLLTEEQADEMFFSQYHSGGNSTEAYEASYYGLE